MDKLASCVGLSVSECMELRSYTAVRFIICTDSIAEVRNGDTPWPQPSNIVRIVMILDIVTVARTSKEVEVVSSQFEVFANITRSIYDSSQTTGYSFLWQAVGLAGTWRMSVLRPY